MEELTRSEPNKGRSRLPSCALPPGEWATPAAAIKWTPNDASQGCERCGSEWNLFFNRRHHCRACGGLFCDACTLARVPLPHLGYGRDPQRVCGACGVAAMVQHDAERDADGTPARLLTPARTPRARTASLSNEWGKRCR